MLENIKYYCDELERSLLLLDKEAAEKLLMEAFRKGSAIEIASQIITATLKKIGDDWEDGSVALSQVYMSGIICEELIDKILPAQSPVRIYQPKMAIGVFEDYHMLGKRIIFSSLRACGFELTDLGGGLTIDGLVGTIRKEKIEIMLLSVLMLPSALHINDLKQRLGETKVKIIVGGAPFRFDEELWKEVGADGFGKDSSEAILVVTKLVEEMK